jgi:hypothetical protein
MSAYYPSTYGYHAFEQLRLSGWFETTTGRTPSTRTPSKTSSTPTSGG